MRAHFSNNDRASCLDFAILAVTIRIQAANGDTNDTCNHLDRPQVRFAIEKYVVNDISYCLLSEAVGSVL